MSITRHVSFALSWFMISSLFFEMILSVFTCWFHNYLTLMRGREWVDLYHYLPPITEQFCIFIFVADICRFSYNLIPVSLSDCTPVSLHMARCSWALTLPITHCLYYYCNYYYCYYYFPLGPFSVHKQNRDLNLSCHNFINFFTDVIPVACPNTFVHRNWYSSVDVWPRYGMFGIVHYSEFLG